MIRHIVLFRSAEIDKVDAVLEKQLMPLVGKVPGVEGIEVGYENISCSGRGGGWDRAVLMTFSGPAELRAWIEGPENRDMHRAMAELTEMLVWDFVC
ncbi:Stress responsive alpha-beta barrel domain-containing protein [Actinobacteria bacterium OK074]|nr:Stress responsive alpha-beta barrel domain-containing protein [Actinobacteria bacterium OK074]